MNTKESVLDVLLYLFEHYFDDAIEDVADQTTLETELEAAGFPLEEIHHAFDWLADLEDRHGSPISRPTGSLRIFADSELLRLNAECRGLLQHLEQLGILNADSRETVIDRLLALEDEEIGVDQVKWVALMVLFTHPDDEDGFARMENLVYDPQGASLH